MRKLNGIFFDLGWTLIQPDADTWNMTPWIQEHYPEIRRDRFPEEQYLNACDHAFEILASHHLLHSQQEEADVFTRYYQRFFADLGFELSAGDAAMIAHERSFNSGFLPLEGAADLLGKLKKQGYQIGIISDTFPDVDQALKKINLYDQFDCRTYSFILGKFKPDPAMYEDALSKMGLPADQTLFIDDMSRNLTGAEHYGIHTVQSLAEPGKVSDGIHPFIHKPMELLPILEQFSRPDIIS